MLSNPNSTSNYIEVENVKLHYLAAGSGETILLIHGWPTSSYLWRNIITPLSKTNQVLALDLPGFGKSGKPLDCSYSFNYYTRIIDAFLQNLGISKTNLVVHDLGGPLGLMWAIRHPEKVIRLGLLNTVVYPDFSWVVKLFLLATFTPLIKEWMSSPSGIATVMRLGVKNKTRLTDSIIANYQSPFQEKAAQKVLLKTAQRLSPKGFEEIAKKLPEFDIPVCIIYGENDRILRDVALTMRRVKEDLPQAQLTSLSNCGHFLQEDEPRKLSELLVEFFSS